jgi:16S rRNA processing protein RimM
MTPQSNPGPDTPTSGPQFLIIGQIMRAHGIRGDLSVKMLTAFPERMSRLDKIYLARDPENPNKRTEHEVTTVRHAKKDQWLLHLAGINGRDEAEILRGLYILVSLKDAVPLEDDEVYLFQVLGLEARTVQGEVLGRVTDIIETGANDVYVINGGLYGEVLLPAISTVIKNIDVENGAMIVEVPAGLLPDPKEPTDNAD